MNTRRIRSEIAGWYSSSKLITRPSSRTFVRCLRALFVNTKVLAANTISLHLHLAGQGGKQQELVMALSRFQVDLLDQAMTLQRQIGSPSMMRPTWGGYAELWRIPDLNNVPAALTLLLEATNQLAGLYESLLSLAAGRQDQARSFYLLAHHLAALNEHLLALEQNAKWMNGRPE